MFAYLDNLLFSLPNLRLRKRRVSISVLSKRLTIDDNGNSSLTCTFPTLFGDKIRALDPVLGLQVATPLIRSSRFFRSLSLYVDPRFDIDFEEELALTYNYKAFLYLMQMRLHLNTYALLGKRQFLNKPTIIPNCFHYGYPVSKPGRRGRLYKVQGFLTVFHVKKRRHLFKLTHYNASKIFLQHAIRSALNPNNLKFVKIFARVLAPTRRGLRNWAKHALRTQLFNIQLRFPSIKNAFLHAFRFSEKIHFKRKDILELELVPFFKPGESLTVGSFTRGIKKTLAYKKRLLAFPRRNLAFRKKYRFNTTVNTIYFLRRNKTFFSHLILHFSGKAQMVGSKNSKKKVISQIFRNISSSYAEPLAGGLYKICLSHYYHKLNQRGFSPQLSTYAMPKCFNLNLKGYVKYFEDVLMTRARFFSRKDVIIASSLFLLVRNVSKLSKFLLYLRLRNLELGNIFEKKVYENV